MKGSRQITHKPTLIHSANPDHSELAVPQYHCWGIRQQPATVPTSNTAIRLTYLFNLGLDIRFENKSCNIHTVWTYFIGEGDQICRWNVKIWLVSSENWLLGKPFSWGLHYVKRNIDTYFFRISQPHKCESGITSPYKCLTCFKEGKENFRWKFWAFFGLSGSNIHVQNCVKYLIMVPLFYLKWFHYF